MIGARQKTVWRNNGQKHMWGEFSLIQEAQQTSSSRNTKWSIPGHIIVKLLQAREKENFKSSKRKRAHHIQGSINMINSHLLTQDHGNQKELNDIQSTQRRKLSTWNSVSSRTPSEKGKKDIFRYRPKESVTGRPASLQSERKWHVGNLGSQEEKSTGNGKYVG